ncbi:MAG: hypothetical protein JRJ21_06820 [Deltaproteobacteria bacterium]|nr:hypothetical protein [Deltaproteobacteria bacterium]
MVSETVNKIEHLLSEIIALQKNYVERTCAECEAPCCSRVSYLFSEKDILFLKLSGRERRWKREILKKKGCWFFGDHGCILDPECRPFICHHYLCSDLETEMERHDPGLLALLGGKFKVIHEMRSQLWSEYLEEQINLPVIEECLKNQ